MKSRFGTLAMLILNIVLTLTCFRVQAQDPNNIANFDSLNAVMLHRYNLQLVKLERQRISDSIRRADLEQQIFSLKENDRQTRLELQNQLQDLTQEENLRLRLRKTEIDSLRSVAHGYAVSGFFNDTLFLIYSKFGSFSAKERAAAITKRIHALAGDVRFKPDSMVISDSGTSSDVMSDDLIILSVSDNDALWFNTSRSELASKNSEIIRKAISNYKTETGIMMLSKEIGMAAIVLLIIIGLIYYSRKLFRWTALKIEQQEDQRIKGLKIKNYTIFDARRQVRVLLNLNAVAKWLVILLIIYISLPILFGIFPWTKNFAQILFGYILNPVRKIAVGLWDYLPNLIAIIIILIVFRYVLSGISFLKSEIEKGDLSIPGFYPDWANPTYQIVRILVLAFMIVVIFPYLPGSNSNVFKGVTVFLGFLFTFSSAGSLSNVMAGLVLTYMRLFKIGDRVKIGEIVGDVIEKSLLVTRVRTIKNEIISIPNATVMSSHTINYSSDAPEKGLIVHSTVTIGYDVPWRKIHQALIDAAERTDLVLSNPKPFVLQTALNDYYVSYQINAYVREANKQAVIYSNLHQNIQDVCNERGIEIMSPAYQSTRDGNAVTIPSEYLPEDYKAPRFNVNVRKDNS